jgi:hypothetical protein
MDNPWPELKIEHDPMDPSEERRHEIICEKLKDIKGYWIVQDLIYHFIYQTYETLEAMALSLWGNWPSHEWGRFMVDYSLDDQLPIIKRNRTNYALIIKDRDTLRKFWSISIETIRNRDG